MRIAMTREILISLTPYLSGVNHISNKCRSLAKIIVSINDPRYSSGGSNTLKNVTYTT